MVTPNHTPDWAQAEQAVREAAALFTGALPAEALIRATLGGEPDTPGHIAYPYWAVNPQHVEKLAELVQAFVAETIAVIVDAGSERDCVMESEALHNVLVAELKEWVPDPSDLPGGPPPRGTGA